MIRTIETSRKTVKAVDWNATGDHATSLGISLLNAIIENLRGDLAELDKHDRETGDDLAGLARDELSVYTRVLAKRIAKPPCKSCGRA